MRRGYASAGVSIATVTATAVSGRCHAIECKTRLAAGSALAGLKTLNRLEQVVARNELAGNDCFEGMTRDADGFVICGTMSNLFAVR